MNDYSIILEISRLTKRWTLSDWRKFRSHNNYWDVKNRFHKQWYIKKRSQWDNNLYSRWLKWKLEKIKEYIFDN